MVLPCKMITYYSICQLCDQTEGKWSELNISLKAWLWKYRNVFWKLTRKLTIKLELELKTHTPYVTLLAEVMNKF